MKKKTMLVMGIFGVLLVFGAVMALAQITGTEKVKDVEDHECTQEMSENMSENCPDQMMQSGTCENMVNGENGCSEMMGSTSPGGNTESGETDHCGDMNSDMGSMMGTRSVEMRGLT